MAEVKVPKEYGILPDWKPYLQSDVEYGKQSRRDVYQDFYAVRANEPEREAYELSEFHKPYMKDYDGLPSWEWNDPPIPPWECIWEWCEEDPDPEPPCWPPYKCNPPNPCEMDDECHFCGVIGPAAVECGKEYTYKTAYLLEGCNLLLDFNVSWSVSKKGATQIATGGGHVTISVPDWCEPNSVFSVTAACPKGCKGSMQVECTCCCEPPIYITGPDSAAAGSTWVGTISPCCRSMAVTTSQDSESPAIPSKNVKVSRDGCTITIKIPNSACGWLKVQGTDDCGNTTDVKTVALGTGSWCGCCGSEDSTTTTCELGYSYSCSTNCWQINEADAISNTVSGATRCDGQSICCPPANCTGSGCSKTCDNPAMSCSFDGSEGCKEQGSYPPAPIACGGYVGTTGLSPPYDDFDCTSNSCEPCSVSNLRIWMCDCTDSCA